MALLWRAGVLDGGRACGSGPGRGQAEQKQPGDQHDVGDVEDAGVQGTDAEDDEIDYRAAMKQAVDQVAQAPAGALLAGALVYVLRSRSLSLLQCVALSLVAGGG